MRAELSFRAHIHTVYDIIMLKVKVFQVMFQVLKKHLMPMRMTKNVNFWMPEEGEFKDPDYSTFDLAFKTSITDDDARRIIEGKQLK